MLWSYRISRKIHRGTHTNAVLRNFKILLYTHFQRNWLCIYVPYNVQILTYEVTFQLFRVCCEYVISISLEKYIYRVRRGRERQRNYIEVNLHKKGAGLNFFFRMGVYFGKIISFTFDLNDFLLFLKKKKN